MPDVQDDALPIENEPSNNARLQITDKLATAPVTVNGPIIVVVSATSRLSIAGDELGSLLNSTLASRLNGWTGGTIYLSRSAGIVTVHLVSVNGSAKTSDTLVNVPAGYRPISTVAGSAYDNTGTWQNLRVTSAGDVLCTQSAGSTVIGTLVYPTTNAWPTSVPT